MAHKREEVVKQALRHAEAFNVVASWVKLVNEDTLKEDMFDKWQSSLCVGWDALRQALEWSAADKFLVFVPSDATATTVRDVTLRSRGSRKGVTMMEASRVSMTPVDWEADNTGSWADDDAVHTELGRVELDGRMQECLVGLALMYMPGYNQMMMYTINGRIAHAGTVVKDGDVVRSRGLRIEAGVESLDALIKRVDDLRLNPDMQKVYDNPSANALILGAAAKLTEPYITAAAWNQNAHGIARCMDDACYYYPVIMEMLEAHVLLARRYGGKTAVSSHYTEAYRTKDSETLTGWRSWAEEMRSFSVLAFVLRNYRMIALVWTLLSAASVCGALHFWNDGPRLSLIHI